MDRSRLPPDIKAAPSIQLRSRNVPWIHASGKSARGETYSQTFQSTQTHPNASRQLKTGIVAKLKRTRLFLRMKKVFWVRSQNESCWAPSRNGTTQDWPRLHTPRPQHNLHHWFSSSTGRSF